MSDIESPLDPQRVFVITYLSNDMPQIAVMLDQPSAEDAQKEFGRTRDVSHILACVSLQQMEATPRMVRQAIRDGAACIQSAVPIEIISRG